jgi:hypothetical protein
MNFSTGHATVDIVGQLHLTGNIVHHSWYQHIRYSNKRGEFTDPWAALILADIVYWYRPVEIRNEQTGHLIGYRKKFAEDKLQRSPTAFSELLCCSEKVARDALSLLESLELIDIELRAIKTGFGVVPTAMFIGLNPQRLQEITHNTSKPETLEKSFLPKSVRRNAEMGKKECRNGQSATTKSVTSSAEMGNSSIYKDFSKEFTENNPPLPPKGEKRHAPANGDFGSKEPTPQPLEEEVVSEHQPQTKPTSRVDVNQSESKECLLARDNKTIDTQSSAYKMEQRFKSRTKAYPKYRTSSGVNGIKTEFLQWLQTSYLPTIQYYQGKKIEIVDAKTWVSNKENAGQQELLEARYEQMLSKQSAQAATQIKQLALTPEEEAWVAIVREIQMVSEGAYVNVTACSEFWLVTTNIAGLSGKLADAIASTPLTDLPVKFKTWYPECYRRAKRKFPQLNFPAPLEPQERAS